MKNKTLALLAIFVIVSMAFANLATAAEYEDRSETNITTSETADTLNVGEDNGVEVMWVKVDGDRVETGTGITESIERGQTLEVKVKVQGLDNPNKDDYEYEDINVFAIISGDERTIVSESTGVFDLDENERKTVVLDITLPEKFEADNYDLRILVLSNTGYTKSYNYPFNIEQPRHNMVIEDVYFSANGGKVMSGRSIFPIIRVENLGQTDEEDVRVEVSIPELGLTVVDYVEEFEDDEELSSDELMLTLPRDAADGLYEMVVTIKYDELTRTATKVVDVEVYGGVSETEETPAEEKTPGRTVVTLTSESQDVTRGEGGAIYPLTLTNEGYTSKTFTVTVSGANSFANVELSPSNLVVLEPSETETLYVYVSAREEATLGAHSFTVDLKSGDETLQRIPLVANVVESSKSDSFKNALEIGLIVLVIVLIVLGLVVVFQKAKKSDEDDMADEDDQVSGQTYY